MKIAIFFALVALASAGQIYQGPGVGGLVGSGFIGGVSLANTGSSSVSRSEDGLGNYHFAYQEQGATGGSSRSESGTGGRVQGSYSLNVGDGRQRTVNYVADEFGYRATIETNEPGTAPLAGADTTITAPDTTGIAAATNQRTAEQLQALANAPPAIEQQVISAPASIAVAQAPVIQQAPLIQRAQLVSAPAVTVAQAPVVHHHHATPILRTAYTAPALRTPVSFSNSISHVATPAIASSIYGAPAFASFGHGLSHGFAAPSLSFRAQPVIQSFSQPIAQQAVFAAPRPTSFSTVVSHDAPVRAAAPAVIQTAPQIVHHAAPAIVQTAPQIVHHAAPQIIHAAPRQIIQATPIVQQRVALQSAPTIAFNPLPAYRQASVGGIKGGWN